MRCRVHNPAAARPSKQSATLTLSSRAGITSWRRHFPSCTSPRLHMPSAVTLQSAHLIPLCMIRSHKIHESSRPPQTSPHVLPHRKFLLLLPLCGFTELVTIEPSGAGHNIQSRIGRWDTTKQRKHRGEGKHFVQASKGFKPNSSLGGLSWDMAPARPYHKTSYAYHERKRAGSNNNDAVSASLVIRHGQFLTHPM